MNTNDLIDAFKDEIYKKLVEEADRMLADTEGDRISARGLLSQQLQEIDWDDVAEHFIEEAIQKSQEYARKRANGEC